MNDIPEALLHHIDPLPLPVPAPRRRTLYGVSVGILAVDTGFRRWEGDIGNAATWPFPVQYRIVRGATPANVTRLQDGALLAPFLEAARELVDAGVDGIVTTCGFLALYQRQLAEALPVPVAASALMQGPMVQMTLPGNSRVGVLTYDAEALTPDYLAAAGLPADTPVIGLDPSSAFCRAIRNGDTDTPYALLESEVLDAARRLADLPGVGALLCECTNLAPFSAAMAEATGLPVWDAVTLVQWFQQGLRPRRFAAR
jgi:Asp/Glu/hydantoin racemase